MTEPEIMAWLGIPPSSGLRLRAGLRERVLTEFRDAGIPRLGSEQIAAYAVFLHAIGERPDDGFYATECAHCGQEIAAHEKASVPGTMGRGSIPVCHPDDLDRPDCYRRVTVYHEPLGVLRGPFALPRGIERIRMTEPLPED